MKTTVSSVKSAVLKLVKSLSTAAVLQYMGFVLVSAVFWCFITFNNDIQQDIDVRLEIINKPANVTFINDPPSTITVTLRDKGSAFVKYLFTSQPKLQIDFTKYCDSGTGYLKLNNVQLLTALRKVISRKASVMSVLPESLSVKYTDQEGKKVPIRFDVDVEPDMRYVQNGDISPSVDSVVVYADRETLSQINEVYTYHVLLSGITDALNRWVSIAPVVGAKLVPSSVKIMVPIERLVQKKQKVAIQARNVPAGESLVLFPSSVDVLCLVPQSEYKSDISNIAVVADYYTIDLSTTSSKVPIYVASVPPVCRRVELPTDSVDYRIEKH